jgi:hypothetical protein
MSRPQRIEFSGTIYHITLRGARLELIDRDDEDRVEHLTVIKQPQASC